MIGLWRFAQMMNWDHVRLFTYLERGFPKPYDGYVKRRTIAEGDGAGFRILTVALPLWKARDIAWLALESLCNQRDITFHWELIVLEEEEHNFGHERLEEYKQRLHAVGCTRIIHLSLGKWMPLPQKWKHIQGRASESSEYFLLQAADCYAHPWRLVDTVHLFDMGADWVNASKGIFYHIGEDRALAFDSNYPGYPTKQGLNMACRMRLLDNYPDDHRRSGVDGFLWLLCLKNKGSDLVTKWTPNHWQTGFDTHGLNNISAGRQGYFDSVDPPFFKLDENFERYIPSYVMERLRSLRPLVTTKTQTSSWVGTKEWFFDAVGGKYEV